jgi:hypothetical protein
MAKAEAGRRVKARRKLFMGFSWEWGLVLLTP